MNDGFIKLHRKLFNHPFWEEKRVFSYAEAWIDLIRRARFELKTGKILCQGRMIECKRGEIVASHRLLGECWGWSTNKVRRFMGLLETEKMITRSIAKEHPQTIIKICKYDFYNKTGENSVLPVEQTQPTGGTDTETEKPNNKNENKEEKENRESEAPTPHPEYQKFREWMTEETPFCADLQNFPRTITETHFFRLKEKYSGTQIAHVLLSIENRRDLRKRYCDLYLTTLKWLKKEYGNE